MYAYKNAVWILWPMMAVLQNSKRLRKKSEQTSALDKQLITKMLIKQALPNPIEIGSRFFFSFWVFIITCKWNGKPPRETCSTAHIPIAYSQQQFPICIPIQFLFICDVYFVSSLLHCVFKNGRLEIEKCITWIRNMNQKRNLTIFKWN